MVRGPGNRWEAKRGACTVQFRKQDATMSCGILQLPTANGSTGFYSRGWPKLDEDAKASAEPPGRVWDILSAAVIKSRFLSGLVTGRCQLKCFLVALTEVCWVG